MGTEYAPLLADIFEILYTKHIQSLLSTGQKQ